MKTGGEGYDARRAEPGPVCIRLFMYSWCGEENLFGLSSEIHSGAYRQEEIEVIWEAASMSCLASSRSKEWRAGSTRSRFPSQKYSVPTRTVCEQEKKGTPSCN